MRAWAVEITLKEPGVVCRSAASNPTNPANKVIRTMFIAFDIVMARIVCGNLEIWKCGNLEIWKCR